MMKKRRTIILFSVLVIVIIAISFFYQNYRVVKQRTVMQDEIDKAIHKTEMLQRKYVEQKAMSESLQRIQISIEGKKSSLQAELTKIKKEFETYKEIHKSLTECKDANRILSEENNGLKKQLKDEKIISEKVNNEHEALVKKLDADHRDKVTKLNASIKSIESRMESCGKKNARLCLIAEELLDHYENKGVISAIMTKEPITQIEKVELEKMNQEYKEEIEKQREKKKENN
jgi:hypothetical protein